MSPRSASEAIREPRYLELPPEADRAYEELSPYLTNEGREAFLRELIHALVVSHAENNLRPVQDVIAAWYRTLLLRSDPNYEENIKRARRSRPRRGVPLEEVRKRFGL